jgi:hypothetical protein
VDQDLFTEAKVTVYFINLMTAEIISFTEIKESSFVNETVDWDPEYIYELDINSKKFLKTSYGKVFQEINALLYKWVERQCRLMDYYVYVTENDNGEILLSNGKEAKLKPEVTKRVYRLVVEKERVKEIEVGTIHITSSQYFAGEAVVRRGENIAKGDYIKIKN